MEHNIDQESVLQATSRRDIRSLAFYLLYSVDRFDYTLSLDDVIENFKTGFNVDIPEDSLAVTIAQGVLEQREALDEQIKPLLKNWKMERLGCCTRIILRIALWELHKRETASSVIINEAIELAKCFAEKDAYKFINGILDETCKKLGISDE